MMPDRLIACLLCSQLKTSHRQREKLDDQRLLKTALVSSSKRVDTLGRPVWPDVAR